MSARYWFSFDDVESCNFGAHITAPRVDDSPKRDVSFYSVAGRNGDVLFDQQRFSNVEVTYSVAIFEDVYRNLSGLKVALFSRTGYRILTDTIHPEEFRMAALSSAFKVSTPKYGGPASFDIVFNCKPQRYLFSGQTAIVFASAGTLNNPYMTALPLIRVFGSGNGEISVGGTVVRLVGQTDTIHLDCDLQDAYFETAEGVMTNANSYISAPTFPKLLPGANAISFSGGVTKLEIVPRWWIL